MLIKNLFFCLCLLCAFRLGLAQNELPVLRSSSPTLSIQDGDKVRENYWHLDPDLALDVYTADKTMQTKRVSYMSDIDTLSFELAAWEHYDFIVILNEQDTFYNRLQSGITFAKNAQSQLPPDTIPFRLSESNNIIVETILNGQDTLQMMFHLANSHINITEEAVKKLTSISLDGSVTANSWGGNGQSNYSLNNSVQIGDKRIDSLVVWQDRHSGPGTDGKFGPDFFDNQIVEIDFDQRYMVIHSQLPQKAAEFETVPLDFDHSLMFVEASSMIQDKAYQHKLLLHTGYAGGILLDDAFVNQYQIGEKLEIVSEKELKDSYGNIIKTKEAILPSLILGNSTLEAVPVGFFEGTIGRQRMSIVGADVIKRFNLILDLQRGELYLQANSLLGVPFSSN
ncbi:MAG: hypothetical protein AAF927_32210 [Bacteroidota bacterium]